MINLLIVEDGDKLREALRIGLENTGAVKVIGVTPRGERILDVVGGIVFFAFAVGWVWSIASVRELGATHRVAARSMGISVGLVSFHLRRAERHLVKRLVDVPTWSSTTPTMRRTSRTRQRTPQS